MEKHKTILIAHNYTKDSFANMSYALAHYLANKGHKVIFMSHHPYFEKPIHESVANGKLIIYSWSSPNRRPTGLKDFFWFAKIYLKHKPDICVGHFVGANITSVVSKILSLGKVKTYLYYHTLSGAINKDNNGANFKTKLLDLRKRLQNRLFVDYRICPSEVAKLDLKNYFNFNKSIVILNPIEDRYKPNTINIDKNKITISYLGRVDPTKGVFEMIEAFTKYQHQTPTTKIQLNIAGGGSNIETLKELIKNNSVITYIGILPYEKVDSYISNSHFIIIPSLFDAFNVVAIESLMNAKPVLISNTTGVSAYLNNNKCCYKFDATEEQMIEVFRKVENNFSTYETMCLEARKTYKELFTIEKYCETMYQLLIK